MSSRTGIHYSAEYRAHVIATARSLAWPTCDGIRAAAGTDHDGRTISRNGMWKWLKEAGVDLSPRDQRKPWPNDVRARAMELVIGGGYSPSGASKIIRRELGKAPSHHKIAEWVEGQYEPKRRPSPVKLAPPPEVDGDSWQAAWDAADALPDGTPQWVRDQAMFAAWIPEMQMGPDETYRSLRSGIKKTQRIKRGFDGTDDIDPELFDTAPGRRLAA